MKPPINNKTIIPYHYVANGGANACTATDKIEPGLYKIVSNICTKIVSALGILTENAAVRDEPTSSYSGAWTSSDQYISQ